MTFKSEYDDATGLATFTIGGATHRVMLNFRSDFDAVSAMFSEMYKLGAQEQLVKVCEQWDIWCGKVR